MASVLEQTPKTAPGIVPLHNGDVLDQPAFHERYAAMPPGFRAELIGGVVYIARRTTHDHANLHGHIIGGIGRYCTYTAGVQLLNSGTIILDDRNEVQPDGVLRLDEAHGGASSVNEQGYVTGTPELHVELAYDAEAIDLHQKREVYERTGVREYLVVLIQEESFCAFRLEGVRYMDFPPDTDGVWRSRVFPGLWLNIRALLDRDGVALLKTLDAGLASEAHRMFLQQLQSGTPE